MNRKLSNCFGAGRLYAPQITRQNIPCADIIGICAVAAPQAMECFILAIIPVSIATDRTDLRGERRRDCCEKNTVLFTLASYSAEHLSICPRRQFASKSATAILSLAALQVFQVFNNKSAYFIPVDLVQHFVDIVFALSYRSFFPLASFFSAGYLIANGGEFQSHLTLVRKSKHFIFANVTANNLSRFLDRQVGQLNPENEMVFSEFATLNEGPAARQPFIEDFSFAARQPDTFALLKSGESDHQIKRTFSVFNRDEFRVQNRAAFENRQRNRLSQFLCGFSRRDDNAQCLFERLTFISLGQAGVLKPGEGFSIQLAFLVPKETDKEVDRATVGFKQSGYSAPLDFSDKLGRDFDRSFHKGIV